MTTPGKIKHLALVKGKRGVGSSAKLLSAEELTISQKVILDELRGWCEIEGVVVGALVGTEGWDVRPLLLVKGELTIIRPTDPALAGKPDQLAALRELYHSVAQTPLGQLLKIRHGDHEKRLWVARLYVADTAAQETFATKKINLAHYVSKVIAQVRKLHLSGVIHGHIHPGNLGVIGDEAVLLDAGFSTHKAQAHESDTLDPVIGRGEAATVSSDVFGLGIVIRKLLLSSATSDQLTCLERMLSDQPSERPKLSEVADAFEVDTPTFDRKSVTPPTEGGGSSSARKGKFLGANKPSPRKPNEVQVSEEVEESGQDQGEVGGFSGPSPAPLPTSRIRRTPQPSTPGTVSHGTLYRVGVGVFALIALGTLIYFGFMRRDEDAGNFSTYLAYWESGDPNLMAKVVQKAIEDPDGEALELILADLRKGNLRSPVRMRILKIAFAPNWSQDLKNEDKVIALQVAALPILNADQLQLRFPPVIAPALAFAFAADLPPQTLTAELARVPTSRLSTLSAPFGKAFAGLADIGVNDMSDPRARAFAHLIVGNSSDGAIDQLFPQSSETSNEEIVRMQQWLSLLSPVLSESPAISDQLRARFNNDNSLLGERLRYLTSDPVGIWKGAANPVLLTLVASDLPVVKLTDEQLADLLQFPSGAVREQVVRELSSILGEPLGDMLRYVALSPHKLTRDQIVLLISALKVKGETGYSLISGWFQSEPDIHAVAGLLLTPCTAVQCETFSLEAIQYLRKRGWKASRAELEQLTKHRESLARALAYSQLSVRIPEEEKILRRAVAQERDVNLKTKLLDKLSAGESENGGG